MAAVLITVWPGRRLKRTRRWLGGALSVVLLLANAGLFVNARYEYYTTLGDVVGVEGDLDSIAALNQTTVPTSGVVVTLPIPGTKSGFDARDAYVYVPPAWFEQPKPKLPVIMLLHGEPGDPSAWVTSGNAQYTSDAFAKAHGGKAPILIMPDILADSLNDTECVDSSNGNAETYLTADVPTVVTERFRTAPPGKQWAAAGFSLGGMCALMLALRHPQLFQTIGDYGGLIGPRSGDDNSVGTTVADYFGGSQQEFEAHDPATLLARDNYAGMGAWFQVGTADPAPLQAAKDLQALAVKEGMATCIVEMPGLGHVGPVWRAGFEDSLPWISARLGLTPATPADTRPCRTKS